MQVKARALALFLLPLIAVRKSCAIKKQQLLTNEQIFSKPGSFLLVTVRPCQAIVILTEKYFTFTAGL